MGDVGRDVEAPAAHAFSHIIILIHGSRLP